VSKKHKKDEDNDLVKARKGDSDGFISWKEQVLNMSKEEFEAFLTEKAEEISSKAADKVLDELVNKVMEEGYEGQ
jgi:hypothetical protein